MGLNNDNGLAHSAILLSTTQVVADLRMQHFIEQTCLILNLLDDACGRQSSCISLQNALHCWAAPVGQETCNLSASVSIHAQLTIWQRGSSWCHVGARPGAESR